MKSWNIEKVEGGFIVDMFVPSDEPSESPVMTCTRRVFADPSKLLNFLHNEFAGSN